MRFINLFLCFIFACIFCNGSADADQPAARHWWNDAVFYEIFTRSFQDSNGDGIGDLNGITARLDYLKTLGVNAVWLTPIFKSPSYHGYDATDFKSVNPDFGTLADFDRLVAAAHGRGIRVVLDIAVNHTSNQHPWFADKSRYVWARQPLWPPFTKWTEVGGEFYYSFFSPKMPDLNWRNPVILNEVESILDFWAARGVDGFRLDAARYYVEGSRGEPDTPETHAAIRAFTAHVRRKFPDRFFVGEIWAAKPIIGTYINGGDQLDLSFDFPTSFALVKSLQVQQGQSFARALVDTFRSVRSTSGLAPILTNHDMVRAPSELPGGFTQLKLAALAYMTLPGSPFIYYGEEIGLPDGMVQPGDLAKRTPMQWDGSANHGFTAAARPWNPFATENTWINVASQIGDRSSLLTYYRALVKLRETQPALRGGLLEPLSLADGRLAGFARRLPREIVAVVLNFGSKTGPVHFDLKIPAGRFASEVLWGPSNPSVTARGNVVRVLYPSLEPVNGSVIHIRGM